MNRRGFLQAILASATAPYVITTAGVLMPVKTIAVPDFNEALLEEIANLVYAESASRISMKPTYVFSQYGYKLSAGPDGYLRVERVG